MTPVDTNPYSSPKCDAVSGGHPAEPVRLSLARDIWLSGKRGATIGGAIGLTALLCVLWIGKDAGAIRDIPKEATIAIRIMTGFVAVPAILGAMGFGVIAIVRHLGKTEPIHATSQLAAFGAGAWRGAKRGFIIVACLVLLIGSVCWSLVFLLFKRSSLESGLKELPLLPVAVCMYGLVGAAIGALVMGMRASRRFKKLQLATPANTDQTQGPPSADQPTADG